MNRPALLFHGGVAGLQVGDIIEPDQSHRKHVDGCPICAALADGQRHAYDEPTPQGWVYATSDRQYARFYASKAVKGDLYRVRLLGDVEASKEDPGQFPTWRSTSAEVVSVLERCVILTMRERRRLFVRWGGTATEAAQLFGSIVAAAGREPRR